MLGPRRHRCVTASASSSPCARPARRGRSGCHRDCGRCPWCAPPVAKERRYPKSAGRNRGVTPAGRGAPRAWGRAWRMRSAGAAATTLSHRPGRENTSSGSARQPIVSSMARNTSASKRRRARPASYWGGNGAERCSPRRRVLRGPRASRSRRARSVASWCQYHGASSASVTASHASRERRAGRRARRARRRAGAARA